MLKNTLCILLLLAGVIVQAQDLSNLGKQKPFTLKGSIGAAGNIYSSDERFKTRPPYSWNLSGHLNGSLYGVSLPVTFVINQYGKSYTSPFAQFGITPTYKWLKVHLGYRNMSFSPLVYDGQSFRGAGIELNPGKLRFGAFYGKINAAINEDTFRLNFTVPQFSRKAVGAKIGFGTERNFFDLMAFYAKDDSSSAKLLTPGSRLRPQENLVLGNSIKFTLFKKLTLSSDIAASLLNEDLAYSKISKDSVDDKTLSFFSGFLPIRNSSVFSYAGQLNLRFTTRNFFTMLGYRRVLPDFKTHGTPYMLNDVEQITSNSNIVFLKGKLNVNLTGTSQHNNLYRNLNTELQNKTATIAINAIPAKGLNTGMSLTGVFLSQKDGLMKLNDSFRLNQNVFNISVFPSYTIFKGVTSNSFSLSFNSNILEDKNPATKEYTELNSFSLNGNYNRQNAKTGIGYLAGILYNRFVQPNNTFSSFGGTLGMSAQLLKKKNLNLRGSIGYQNNQSSTSNASGNIIYDLSSGFRMKSHSFNAFANYVRTPPSIVVHHIPYVVASNNFYGGLSYNYSF